MTLLVVSDLVVLAAGVQISMVTALTKHFGRGSKDLHIIGAIPTAA